MNRLDIYDFIKRYEDFQDFLGFFRDLKDQFIQWQAILVNSIGIEEYNKLLESIHEIIISLDSKNYGSNGERLRGAIFTPKQICRLINNRVLNYYSTEYDIQLPKVLDPSCGYGFFLIDFLFLILQRKIDKDKIYSILIKEQLKGIDIDLKSIEFSRSIFLIIFIFIIMIFEDRPNQEQHYKNIHSSYFTLKKHILNIFTCSNFLKMENDKRFGRFDIIIGNPPYIRVHKIDKQLNEYLRNNFFTPFKDFDIYICFFEQSLKFLSKNGVLGFITPEKYLSREYAKKLRILLLNNTYIKEIIDVSRCKDIFKAFIYPVITILVKFNQDLIFLNEIKEHKPDNCHFFKDLKIKYIRIDEDFQPNVKKIYEILELNENNTNNSNKKIIYIISEYSDFIKRILNNNNVFTFPTVQGQTIIEEIFDNFYRIGDFIPSNRIFCGTPRAKDYKKLKNAILEDEKDIKKNSIKYIVSKNLIPFKTVWGIKIDSIGEKYYKPYFNLHLGPYNSQTIKHFKEVPKIIISGNGKKIIAAIDNEGFVLNGIYAISLNNIIKMIDEDILLIILNSNLINYYVLNRFTTYMMNSKYLSINSAIINAIPLPIKKSSKINQDSCCDDPTLIEKMRTKLMKINKELDEIIEVFIYNNSYSYEIRESYFKELKKSILEGDMKIERINCLNALFKDMLSRILIEIKDLNKMVYLLFGIPDKVVEIIENSLRMN